MSSFKKYDLKYIEKKIDYLKVYPLKKNLGKPSNKP